MTKKSESTNKPAFEARLGSIRVVVWANESDSGRWHNVTLTRRYKDGDDWKDSSSFSGLGDLAQVMEACRLARDFIASQELYPTDSE